jgi:hypothetical protein
MEGNINAEMKRASYAIDDFNKLIKNYKGDVEVIYTEFDKYLRGKKANLPQEFKAVAGRMRTHIDNLSKMLLQVGAVTPSQAETIASNLGEYINRSYQVFDKKEWGKYVREERNDLIEAAKNELRAIFRANTGTLPRTGISGFDQAFTAKVETAAAKDGLDVDTVLEKFINDEIDRLIDRDSAEVFLGIGKKGSKDMSIMEEKDINIPLTIRQLMGEYTDPAQNYARTILKIATFAEKHKFLQSVRDNGLGVYFFYPEDVNKPKEFNTLIAGKTSETMSPLNGLMTTPELANAFRENIGTANAIEAMFGFEMGPTVRGLYEKYMKALSVVKWNKTIASVATQAKNFLNNVWFMTANGYVNPKEFGRSFMVLKNSSNEQLRDKLDEYIRNGIVGQSVDLREINDMFKDANFETAIDSRLNNGIVSKTKRFGKSVKTGLENLYQMSDDFYKIVGYEIEKSRRSDALFSKPFDELNDDQKEIIRAEAAGITKNVQPNYDRIPNLVRLLRVVPIKGTFMAFQSEAIRTTYNTVALAMQEMRSDNKKIKKIGYTRLAGMVATQSFKYGLMSAMGMAVIKSLSGGDDDEDEMNRYVKMYVAPWSKNSDIVLVSYGKGKMSYIDFSASDPHGGIQKAVNAAMSGESLADSFTDSMGELFSPFTDENILKNAIDSAKDNKNSYGGTLYNETDSDIDKIAAISEVFYNTFEPGTGTSVRKLLKSDDPRAEILGELTGYKVRNVDINKQMNFAIKDLKGDIDNKRKGYYSDLNKFERDEISEDKLIKSYERSNTAQKETYKKMIEQMKAASFFGVDDADIYDTMKKQGVAKRDIDVMWYGETPEFILD